MLKMRLLEITYKLMLILSAFCLQYLLLGESNSPVTLLFTVSSISYIISAVSEHYYMKFFAQQVIEKETKVSI